MRLFRIAGAATAAALGLSLLAFAAVSAQEGTTPSAGGDMTSTVTTGGTSTPGAGGGSLTTPTRAASTTTPEAGGAEALPSTGMGGGDSGMGTALLIGLAGAALIAGAGVVAAGTRRNS